MLLYAVEHVEESLLVEFLKGLLGLLAEEDVRCLDGHVEIFL